MESSLSRNGGIATRKSVGMGRKCRQEAGNKTLREPASHIVGSSRQ